MMTSNKLLTPEEVAGFLRVHVGTLAQWRVNEKGPRYIKVEGQVRYREEDLTSFLESSTVSREE